MRAEPLVEPPAERPHLRARSALGGEQPLLGLGARRPPIRGCPLESAIAPFGGDEHGHRPAAAGAARGDAMHPLDVGLLAVVRGPRARSAQRAFSQ